MLSSYLLQIPPHNLLQVQNSSGAWIPCPPIPGTLVVAMGQGLEAITAGVVTSTTHRVLSPQPGEGPRFSIPFFQGVSYDVSFEPVDISINIQNQKQAVVGNDVEMTFRKDMFERLGDATLTNRVKVPHTPSSLPHPSSNIPPSPIPTSARNTTPTSSSKSASANSAKDSLSPASTTALLRPSAGNAPPQSLLT